MNNQRFTLFLLLFIAFFGSVSAQKKPQLKDRNKEKVVKTSEIKDKETRGKAELSGAKTTAAVKIDTLKTTRGSRVKSELIEAKAELSGAKPKDVKSEFDSLITANFNLNLKLLKKKAHASYYHSRFNGRRTASGKRFDNNGYTAAHKKLPFGTKVKVTNEANGKSVIVEITDRGPFSKAREIDLSKKAFMEIASNKNSGVVIVTIEEILEPK